MSNTVFNLYRVAVAAVLGWLVVSTAGAASDAELRRALDAARAGDDATATAIFSDGAGNCMSAFDTPRDRSDCLLLRTLSGDGMRAFCDRQLEYGQATLRGIREASRVDPSNTQALAHELHVLLQADDLHRMLGGTIGRVHDAGQLRARV